jgi:hypothetical protein
VTDGELPREAVDEVQADRERDVDANEVDDAGVVRIDLEIAEAILEDVIQEQQARNGDCDTCEFSAQAHCGARPFR